MYKLSAIELREKFVNGEISATEIAQYFLKRVQQKDKEIGAFLSVLEERMLRKAESLDKKRKENKPLGKLAGVPIAIKDNIHIKGEITTCGSKFLTNYRAVFDASCIEFLEQEDALLIGKTNLDEFAMGSSTENSALLKTRNPWDLDCSPGGSSGGSSAAVAARFCPLSLGSDTGGSIRQPAALTGTVGFKPTYGRVSRSGLVAFASSLDQIGPFATSTKDAALIMEVMGRHCDKDATSLYIPQEEYLKGLKTDLKGIKVGIPRSFIQGLSPEAKANFDASSEVLKNLGAELIDVDLDILKYCIAVYYVLATAEASTNLARFDGVRYGHRSAKASTLDEVYFLSKQEGFGREVKTRILLGTYVLSSGFQNAYYQKAQKVRRLIINAFDEAYSKCGIIAMPCSPIASFKIGEFRDPLQMYLQDIYTISANLAGLPAISVPSGFSQSGHPFGLQLLGPALQDGAVLSAAHAFENATPFTKKISPLFDKHFDS